MRDLLLILLALGLVGVLAWIVSKNGALNLRDPRAPLFEGSLPTPSPVPTAVSGRPPRERFTVSSFNIHFGYEADVIGTTLRANGMADADIVLLQECNERAARVVAAELGMAFAYYPAAVHPHSRDFFGVAVLSRWPIVAHRKILLPDKSVIDGARKAAMAAVVTVDGVPIKVVNIHLQSGMMPGGFRSQLKSVMECAIEDDCHNDKDPSALPPARATVVGGDFNTWIGSLREPLFERMKKYDLAPVDGVRGTFSKSRAANPSSKHTFDYFFAAASIIVGPGRVGTDRTGSDHYPIAAEFRLR